MRVFGVAGPGPADPFWQTLTGIVYVIGEMLQIQPGELILDWGCLGGIPWMVRFDVDFYILANLGSLAGLLGPSLAARRSPSPS